MNYVLLSAVVNTDLLQPAAGGASAVAVPSLVTITPPMPNTKLEDYRYFHCTMAVANMHRQDGKKLPFIQHVLKTNIKEDITYLMKEIEEGNQYIRVASAEEIQRAQIMEDPMGAVRKAVVADLSLDDLEALIAQRRIAAASTAKVPLTDAARIAGVDVNAAAREAIKAQDVRSAGGTVGIASTKSFESLMPKSIK